MERFIQDVAVRWSDLDAYGHVNNARFLTLYEEARVAMFFTGARAGGLTSFEEGIVIARHEIDYLRQVGYTTEHTGAGESPRVRVELWISDLRAARLTVNYELYDGSALVSRAKSVCVPYNLASAHPRRLTEAERDFLEPYLEG
jgi:acyl-CoA thioester hydrolase